MRTETGNIQALPTRGTSQLGRELASRSNGALGCKVLLSSRLTLVKFLQGTRGESVSLGVWISILVVFMTTLVAAGARWEAVRNNSIIQTLDIKH